MRPFVYLEPHSLEEACQLLSRYNIEAKLIAGGQSLLPLLKYRLIAPKYIINLKGLPGLDYIQDEGDGARIGALTTHRAVELSPLIREKLAILAEMEKVVASVQIRNWGTLGGDMCHADPGGDPGPALVALEAKARAVSERGNREIPLSSFYVNYLETALASDEILTEIEVPYPAFPAGTAYIKESVRWGDYPIASVAAVVLLDRNYVKDARIALGGAGNTPVRARGAEKILAGRKVEDSLEEVGEAAAREAEPRTDVEGSAEYKRAVIKVVARQAVSQAIRRAQEQTLIRGQE